MINWTDIHSEFTDELEQEWEGLGFTYEQTEKWIEKGGLCPDDAKLALYLKTLGYRPEEVEEAELDLDWYREEFTSKGSLSKEKTSPKENTLHYPETEQKDWNSIHFDFTSELIYLWQSLGFSYQQAQEWINVGLDPSEVHFCYWLDKVVGMTAEEVLNCTDIQGLKTQFSSYQAQAQIIQSSKDILRK